MWFSSRSSSRSSAATKLLGAYVLCLLPSNSRSKKVSVWTCSLSKRVAGQKSAHQWPQIQLQLCRHQTTQHVPGDARCQLPQGLSAAPAGNSGAQSASRASLLWTLGKLLLAASEPEQPACCREDSNRLVLCSTTLMCAPWC